MNTVFFGSSKYVLPIIETLNPALVITTEKHITQPVPAFCKAKNIPYITIDHWDNETIERLSSLKAPVAVLASFGKILPQSLLDVFPKGILNIHPSLLPKYRGSLPVQAAILHGDTTTGISIIKLDSEMDHGPLLAQEEVAFLPEETADAAYLRFFKKGAAMLYDALPDYLADKKGLTEQDHTKATYTNRHLSREDGFIESSNPPPKDVLKRMILAYHPWPGVWTKLVMPNGDKRIVKLLPGDTVQVEGKKPMSVKDFINGYPTLKEVINKLVTLV